MINQFHYETAALIGPFPIPLLKLEDDNVLP